MSWLLDRFIDHLTRYLERKWQEHVAKVMSDCLARECPDFVEINERAPE